ncbi:type II toxin-antitoxin system death-on-curing family toxin [Helicobacter suis]|uniref:type II toxin-antitoxin system death-on-curing family toxin n=1 Tax=Helicobacter suis TaxID=104628 RepID=UPI0019677BCD
MKYLKLEHAIAIHDEIMDLTKGLKGYNKAGIGYLASALEHIQNDDFYPSFCSKLAHLMFSCIKFHPFNDGNKRTSIYLGMHFLVMNGYCYNNFASTSLEDMVVQVAEGTIDKADLQVFLEQHLQSLKQDKTPALDSDLHNGYSQDSSTPQHKEFSTPFKGRSR